MRRSPSCAQASARPADPEAPLDPAVALTLATRAARRMLRRAIAPDSDAARDVAADALVVLLQRALPLRRLSVLTAVKYVVRRLAARWMSLVGLEEANLADQLPLAWAQGGADEPERAAAGPLSRTFGDSSTARLDGEPCEADVEALTLEAPDGSVTCGNEALRRAHRLLLEERRRAEHPQRAQNARRAVSALDRDAQLLAVVGLPWRAALDRLAASGVVVTRDGLRSGQRAARLRCMGLTAHHTARR